MIKDKYLSPVLKISRSSMNEVLFKECKPLESHASIIYLSKEMLYEKNNWWIVVFLVYYMLQKCKSKLHITKHAVFSQDFLESCLSHLKGFSSVIVEKGSFSLFSICFYRVIHFSFLMLLLRTQLHIFLAVILKWDKGIWQHLLKCTSYQVFFSYIWVNCIQIKGLGWGWEGGSREA